jgi:hypothetical protein
MSYIETPKPIQGQNLRDIEPHPARSAGQVDAEVTEIMARKMRGITTVQFQVFDSIS